MDNMDNYKERDVLIFETWGGHNGTIKKEHGMYYYTQTINKNAEDTRIRER